MGLRIQRWNMLRTKCFNVSMMRLGFHANREYINDITGSYLGVKCMIRIPVRPWRIEFFIPSVYTLNAMLDQRRYYQQVYKRLKTNL